MKTLYLIRHAKSSWDYTDLSDFDRPLNGRGKRDSPEMGKRLQSRGVQPDFVLSSPAVRAIATCKNIVKELHYEEHRIRTNQNIYHAGKNTLLQIIQNIPDRYSNTMLFGHNPGFTYFANALAKTTIYNIPTCGVFACFFNTASWQQIGFGDGELLFYDYPKNQN